MRLFRFTNHDGDHWIAADSIDDALRRAIELTRRDRVAGRFCPVLVADRETEETRQAIIELSDTAHN